MLVEVEWQKLRAPEIRAIAARPGALAILPIGSLEQHGPHLPVITDTASASAAAIAAARLVADEVPVVVLPGLWLGMSEHHLPFGGTITLDYATLRAVLGCIVRSLVSGGFGRLLIVNGHGGNIDPLAVAVRELAVEYDMPIVACLPWDMAPDEVASIMETAPGAGHACEGEASLMLEIMPDAVRPENFAAALGNQKDDWHLPRGASRFYSFSERRPVTGTMGDPRPATAAKGAAILTAQAHAVAQLIRDSAAWTPPDQVWAPGRGQRSTMGRDQA
ncbi:creatininase family protein [Paracoccus sp. CPCC 101403]|uniref:Creatininase family protein n=1 Tax=Paracoccus broussonetiae TaxID=3075834 RepID=A0ABU3EJA9_9RHOB|nr:creatininase family protein [Paracoccus sp. CPCC 101403]MDT1064161.1 creatininase family protein [Paracoccus sp. CPCC 101403]